MTVGYEVREQIAYISFNRPEKHNALRDEDIAGLVDALGRLDVDDGAHVGIVFGQGPSFSSGGDVSERLQRSMDEGSTSSRTTEGDAFTHCENWKPVIAAVHGYCLGHALGTALHCDHLVAARSSRFQVTEIRLGLPTVALLPRLGRPAFANEVAMTGRMFGAEEAWEAGIVTRLVDDGQHVEAATELAAQILESPQWAVRQNVRVRRLVVAEAAARHLARLENFDWATSTDARDAVAKLAARVQPGARGSRAEL
ncbi:MAG TPA: enoyl-CoA hydratase/isomerase family protein [Acidimicrobiia bacterium]|nr:enoyl-CoA hydratase/isomerase family protein [Acidimicrobiia bacterium]